MTREEDWLLNRFRFAAKTIAEWQSYEANGVFLPGQAEVCTRKFLEDSHCSTETRSTFLTAFGE